MSDIFKIREFGYLQKGLDMALARQGAITANIANSSTPGYKAVRVDFEESMKAALGKSLGMKETNPGHLPLGMKGVQNLKPQYRESQDTPRLDGNNVNLDQEFSIGAVNTINYKVLTAVTTKRLKTLLAVINSAKK